MGVKAGIGKTGFISASAVALAMCLIAYLIRPIEMSATNYGFCLPSPGLWELPPLVSWLVNLATLAAIAVIVVMMNRTFNFVRTTEPALPAIFLIATASSPWFTQEINASVILCLVNVVSLAVIFGAYDRQNATQQIFCLGVLLGIGVMFQYAFLAMIPLYFLWALFLKILRLKEALAFITGILCPYWIGLGLGFLSFHDFRLPALSPFFGNETDSSDLFFLMISTGVATVITLLISLTNGMKLYAGNSKVNAMNLCIMMMGLISVICIFIDYENMPAYVVTLFLTMAVQLANICALWNVQYEWVVTLVPSLVFISLFLGSVFL